MFPIIPGGSRLYSITGHMFVCIISRIVIFLRQHSIYNYSLYSYKPAISDFIMLDPHLLLALRLESVPFQYTSNGIDSQIHLLVSIE